jgi:hypothetical protein
MRTINRAKPTAAIMFAAVCAVTIPFSAQSQRSGTDSADQAASISYAVKEEGLVVTITNRRLVPLDAWELAVTVTGSDGRTKTLGGVRHDFYRDAVNGDRIGQGSIQPGETRTEPVGMGEAASGTRVELLTVIYRDLTADGRKESIDLFYAARTRDASEYDFWIKQIDASLEQRESSAATLRTAVEKRQSQSLASSETHLPQILCDQVAAVLNSPSTDYGTRLAALRNRFVKLRDAGSRHKQQ